MSEYEYNNLLYKTSKRLDNIHVSEQLLVICRGKLAARSEESSILNVRSLFTELESNDCLGIDCLDTLKEILNQTHENNLLKEVEEFEQRQNHDLKSERRKGIVPASVVDWFK